MTKLYIQVVEDCPGCPYRGTKSLYKGRHKVNEVSICKHPATYGKRIKGDENGLIKGIIQEYCALPDKGGE
jgi:hypothetical protein